MGFGKKIMYGLYKAVRRNPSMVKKIIIGVGVLAASGVVIAGLLVYFIVGAVKGLATSAPDIDLVALRELVAGKEIVLTEAQREHIAPLLRKLAEENPSPAESEAVKTQIFGLLDPVQRQRVEAWKAEAATKAAEFTSSPQRALAYLERATGVSMKPVEEWLGALTAWWKTTKPEDSAQRLREALGEGK